MRAKYLGEIAPGLAAVLAAMLAYFSPVANTNSDPQFGLLVSQAMLRFQTVQMDVYRETFAPIVDRAFVTIGEHLFYYFPLGTPIYSIPFVAIANLLGLDMAVGAQEAAVQNFISAVVVGLSFFLLYRICYSYLPMGESLAITTTTFFGSALISTMSTALWSIDFAVLFVVLSLLILVKLSLGAGLGKGRQFFPFLLGFTLFSAYLCRPSTFLFVALVLGYLLLVDRKTFWRTAVFAAFLLAGFLLFIRLGYGSWLPPYYNDFGRLAVERPPLFEAFFGNLVSPSRGLFIYSPIFVLTLAGSIYFFSKLKQKPLFWLMIIWFFLQLILVARTTRWWGGLSFGPRILTEMLPGLVLLTALVVQVFLGRVGQRRLVYSAAGLYIILAVWAVFLNSYQALFNRYTALWHSALTPNIDYAPEYLWRWDYPQFLADNELLCERDQEFMTAALNNKELIRKLYPYEPGRPLEILEYEPFLMYEYLEKGRETAGTEGSRLEENTAANLVYSPFLFQEGKGNLTVLLSGWSNPQFGYRWSMCETATITFLLDKQVDTGQLYELSLQSGSFDEQRVNIWLNGVELGQLVFNGTATPPVSQSILIPPDVLQSGATNQIVLELPDSVIPDLPNEVRRLGLSFVSFEIQPAQ